MNRRKPYWVDQEPDPRSDEDLTEENKLFLHAQRLKLEEESPLLIRQFEKKPWIPGVTQRCGLVAIKIGLYPMWTKEGKKMDCTIYQVPDNRAIRYVPPSDIDEYISLRDPRGYWLNNKRIPSWIAQKRWGLQIVGAVSADPINFTSAWCGLFKQAGVPPMRKLSRFLVSPDAALEPGSALTVHHFRVGDRVDVTARTINRGFQGVIERWGMSGGPKAHGSTKFHRRMGSAGGGGVVRINPKFGLIYLAGTTVGPVHAYSLLHDSWLINRRHEMDVNPPPVPTWFADDDDVEDDGSFKLADDFNDDFAHDIYHEILHRSDDPSITFERSG